MSLQQLIQVSVNLSATALTAPGFGVPMLLAYHTHYPDFQRTYTSLAGMVTDGFATTEPAYLMAETLLSQSSPPASFVVGRRTLPPTQTLTLTVNNATPGAVYTVTANTTPISYTVPTTGSPTTSTVATALGTLLSAVAGFTVSVSGAVITITSSAGIGHLNNLTNINANFSYADITADPGIQTDLNNIFAVNPNWYALGIDSNSKAEILSAAAWVEANKKIFPCNNSDTACGTTGGTTDVMAMLKASDYTRTACLFSQTEVLSYSGVAWMSNRLTATPGSDTWAYKSLVGVSPDALTPTVAAAVLAKNGNTYTELTSNGADLGTAITLAGTSGSGEFMDLVRGIDWLVQTFQIDVVSLLINNAKIPYTDAGADVIRSALLADCQTGINVGLLAATPAPTVSIPLVANIDANDIANRNLPQVVVSATLAGAIHTVVITLNLTV